MATENDRVRKCCPQTLAHGNTEKETKMERQKKARKQKNLNWFKIK